MGKLLKVVMGEESKTLEGSLGSFANLAGREDVELGGKVRATMEELQSLSKEFRGSHHESIGLINPYKQY